MSDSEDKVVTEDVPKKKPGRPKKQIIKKTVPKLGIVNEPSNNNFTDVRMINIFELLYDNPLMFKKIFSLFKSMFAETITVKLEKENIKMYALNHYKTAQIYVNIKGNKMNRYYLNKPLEFGLSSGNIQKIFQTLNKNCSKISWFTSLQHERSKIKIGLTNDEMEEDSIYTLDLDQVPEYNWAVEEELALEQDYMLKFELPSSYFKKKVNDFILLGKIMKIEKHGDNPLRLSYVFENGNQNTSFKNIDKIKLNSKIGPNDIFSTSVYLSSIKPLASSLISDYMQVSACIDKKIIFTALLDQDEKLNKEKIPDSEKCEIKILVDFVEAKAKTET